MRSSTSLMFSDSCFISARRASALSFAFFRRAISSLALLRCGFALFIFADQFAPFFVERTEAVQIERGVALLRHFGEFVQMITEII